MTEEPCAARGAQNGSAFDIERIMKMLPHRYPFLLVDRVISCVPGEYIAAYKNVSFNEPFFQGHFPDLPVMPGVLIMEALAQAGGLMVLADWPQEKIAGHIFLFSGLENVKFRQPVRPGDRLDLECALIRRKLQLWKMSGKAWVDGKLAAQGELSAAMMRKGDF
ncbi:MAG: 3-hydroxyacyl-ACP dehydratase FabZ [Deltaproteobacteria bacterium]|jgi:3-hydroxyacyl-[acyl-carrier-protein] dehydratase|nr:3-hydroxyacyl-ACP dehydratase FabZ [Deltaproteobacteria bacterium]